MDSRGLENKNIYIDDKSPLITKLNVARYLFDQEDEMKELRAVNCIGIFIRKNLIGILALGPKKSGEDYSEEDFSVLNILADALGVAITNAIAYEELRHKENLVTIGTLASGIKHDISKPISYIGPEISDFLTKQKKNEFSDQTQALQEAGILIEKCWDTFKQVLSISDTYAAKPQEKERPVELDVLETIDTSLIPLQNKLDEKGITIVKEIPSALPKIFYDKDYMRRILDNIIGNAIDAIEAAHRSRDESKITIRAKEIANRTLNVQIEIMDTGTGIPQKIRDKIFKSWFTTKGDKGTGLGLSLVSELVLRGGGTIDVQSEEGKGSTFILGLKGVKGTLDATRRVIPQE
jgi:signal transduction histidine kinase